MWCLLSRPFATNTTMLQPPSALAVFSVASYHAYDWVMFDGTHKQLSFWSERLQVTQQLGTATFMLMDGTF